MCIHINNQIEENFCMLGFVLLVTVCEDRIDLREEVGWCFACDCDGYERVREIDQETLLLWTRYI